MIFTVVRSLNFVRFKLHLAPKPPANIPPLPRSKTAVDVLSDFLQYLFICLKTFLSETHPSPYGSGSDGFWKTLTGDVTFILSHPNGWGGLQQGHLKQVFTTFSLGMNDFRSMNIRLRSTQDWSLESVRQISVYVLSAKARLPYIFAYSTVFRSTRRRLLSRRSLANMY